MFSVIIPDVDGIRATGSTTDLERVGLADLVAGSNQMPIPEGPTGRRGVHWSWPRPGEPAEHDYNPDQQIWLPAVAWDDRPAGRYWIGFDKDKPLGPEQLRRPYQERGTKFQFGDGKQWLLPTDGQLPRDIIYADDGSARFELQRKFSDYANEAFEWRQKFANGDPNTVILWDEASRFVLSALRINYRITPEIACNHLRLISQSNVVAAIFAALGVSRDGGG